MNKKKLIIYAFGTSDLYVNGEKFSKNSTDFNFEEETCKLKEDFGENKISFPIFESFIEKLDKENNYILLGIFTKQKEIYKLDTHNLEKIFDKYLQKYNFKKYIKFSKTNICLEDARKTTSIYKEIKSFFNEKKDFLNTFYEIIVNITGGTKGIVLGSFQACISSFDIEKLNFFIINEENNNVIKFLNIKNDIIKNNDIKNIKLLINNYDFLGIYNYTKRKKDFENINKISEYCFRMIDFEIDIANQIYNDLENEGINLPFYFKEKDILKLSIDGIYFTFKIGKLVEFLGRIYSFSDILSGYLIKEKLGIDLKDKQQYKNLKNYVNSKNKDLEKYLNNFKSEERILSWDPEKDIYLKEKKFLNLPVKIAILKYFEKEELYIDLEIYINFLEKIEELNKFRNKTIIAHGTDGVSIDKINKNFDGDISENLKEIYLKLDFGEIFFIEKINKILNDILKK